MALNPWPEDDHAEIERLRREAYENPSPDPSLASELAYALRIVAEQRDVFRAACKFLNEELMRLVRERDELKKTIVLNSSV